MPTKKTQTDKPRRYHAEFRLTTSWSRRDENPDKRRYHANYESKFKPGTDEHTIDFWEEVLNCFGPLKTPYEEKIRLYRKSDGETAPLNPYDDVTLDSCEAAFDEQEKIQRLHDAEKAAEEAAEEVAKNVEEKVAEEAEEKAAEEAEEKPAEQDQTDVADSGDAGSGPLPDENGGEKDETGEEPAGDTVDAEDGTVPDGEKTVDNGTDFDCDDDSAGDIDSDDEPSDTADRDTETTKDDTLENE